MGRRGRTGEASEEAILVAHLGFSCSLGEVCMRREEDGRECHTGKQGGKAAAAMKSKENPRLCGRASEEI